MSLIHWCRWMGMGSVKEGFRIVGACGYERFEIRLFSLGKGGKCLRVGKIVRDTLVNPRESACFRDRCFIVFWRSTGEGLRRGSCL